MEKKKIKNQIFSSLTRDQSSHSLPTLSHCILSSWNQIKFNLFVIDVKVERVQSFDFTVFLDFFCLNWKRGENCQRFFFLSRLNKCQMWASRKGRKPRLCACFDHGWVLIRVMLVNIESLSHFAGNVDSSLLPSLPVIFPPPFNPGLFLLSRTRDL